MWRTARCRTEVNRARFSAANLSLYPCLNLVYGGKRNGVKSEEGCNLIYMGGEYWREIFSSMLETGYRARYKANGSNSKYILKRNPILTLKIKHYWIILLWLLAGALTRNWNKWTLIYALDLKMQFWTCFGPFKTYSNVGVWPTELNRVRLLAGNLFLFWSMRAKEMAGNLKR